ncbi:MAG: hypothetical protein Q9159_006264 [Coniocarpon cinnabarinum]
MYTYHAVLIASFSTVVFGAQTINRLAGQGLTFGRMDPIRAADKLSTHGHVVFGGNKFSISMDDVVATTSICANSLVKGDGSNYWTPMLFFNGNGSFTSVPVDYSNMFVMSVVLIALAPGHVLRTLSRYYKFEPAGANDKIVPFPKGFRMTSGNAAVRSPPKNGAGLVTDHSQGDIQPIEITCPTNTTLGDMWPAGSDGTKGVGIGEPGTADPAGPDNYEENTDWPTNGACPDGWDHIPHLFYEVYYQTTQFDDQWDAGQMSQPFVLANGDSTGYSLHGDFLSGWDPDVLKTIIGCSNGDSGGGAMNECPGLTQDMVYGDSEASGCTVPPYNPGNEQILGTMDELPGCNPVVGYGPDVDMATSCSKDAGYSAATTMPSSDSASRPNTATATSTNDAAAMQSSAQSAPAVSAAGSAEASQQTADMAPPAQNPDAPMQPVPTSQSSPPTSGLTGYSGSSSNSSTGNGSAAPQGWTALGCFTDAKDQRVLTGATTNMMQSMTIPQCTDFCSQNGFAYAGLEWKSECYCGDSAPTESSDQCSDQCAGDSSTTCGGWNAINVYQSQAATKSKRNTYGRLARHRRFHRQHEVGK